MKAWLELKATPPKQPAQHNEAFAEEFPNFLGHVGSLIFKHEPTEVTALDVIVRRYYTALHWHLEVNEACLTLLDG